MGEDADNGARAGGAEGGRAGSDASGGSDGRRARWKDLVAQLKELKASNKAAEGEVAKVLEQVGGGAGPGPRQS